MSYVLFVKSGYAHSVIETIVKADNWEDAKVKGAEYFNEHIQGRVGQTLVCKLSECYLANYGEDWYKNVPLYFVGSR